MALHGFDLVLTGAPALVPEVGDYRACESALGMPLPMSFRGFLDQHGYGTSADFFILFTVARCAPACATLLGNLPRLRRKFADFDRDGRPAALAMGGGLQQLLPFGETENGDCLAWETSGVSAHAEPAIAIVATRGDSLVRVEGGLVAFFRAARAGHLPGWQGRAFPAVFAPQGAPRGVVNCRACDELVTTLSPDDYRCPSCGWLEGRPQLLGAERAQLRGRMQAFVHRLITEGQLELDADTEAQRAELVGALLAVAEPGVSSRRVMQVLLEHPAVAEVFASDAELLEKLTERQPR